MRVDSTYRYIGITVLVAVLVGGILWFVVNSQLTDHGELQGGEAVAAQSVAPEVTPGVEAAPKAVVVTTTASDQKSQTPGQPNASENSRDAQIEARLAEATKNVKKMRELLDDESKRADVLAFARNLLKHGIASERLAALEALQWLGGRDSVDLLLPMLSEEEDLTDTVDDTLRGIIEESLYTDVRVMDKEDWLEALKAAGNEDGMNVYLTLLSAFPELDSVPVLLELFKSDSALNKKMAQEYMEFIAHGESLPTVKDAQDWWKKWLADRNITEQDLIDYENAGKEDNDALKGDNEDADTADEEQDVPASDKTTEVGK